MENMWKVWVYTGAKIDMNKTLYRSGTANWNTVNSKFHLIRSFNQDFARFLSFHVENAWLIRTRLIRSSTKSKPFTFNLIRTSCNSNL